METKKIVVAPQNPAEGLIQQAIEKGVPVETMEKLLAMRRELKAEFAKESFNRSMAKFQSECPTIVKTKPVNTKSGVVAYRYAPIESIVEQVKQYLESNGFSYSTSMEVLPSGVRVSCKVVHVDGHTEISTMEVPLGNKTDVMSASQVTAAASTFAKRYAFCNAFGILTGDEDSDASPGLSKTIQNQPQATEAPQNGRDANYRSASVKQLNFIKKLALEKGVSIPEEYYHDLSLPEAKKKIEELMAHTPKVNWLAEPDLDTANEEAMAAMDHDQRIFNEVDA